MADATIKAWSCDICNKKFTNSDAGYKADYSLKLISNTGGMSAHVEEEYEQICIYCAMKISDTINTLINQ